MCTTQGSGRDHHFHEIKSPADFRRTYDRYARLAPIAEVRVLAPDPLFRNVEQLREITPHLGGQWPEYHAHPADPFAVFGLLLGRTMKIDPEARSSMWEDLQRRRRTEIDYLQGVIIAIAERRGLEVPLSRRVVALIKSAEADSNGSPGLTPQQIRP